MPILRPHPAFRTLKSVRAWTTVLGLFYGTTAALLDCSKGTEPHLLVAVNRTSVTCSSTQQQEGFMSSEHQPWVEQDTDSGTKFCVTRPLQLSDDVVFGPGQTCLGSGHITEFHLPDVAFVRQSAVSHGSVDVGGNYRIALDFLVHTDSFRGTHAAAAVVSNCEGPLHQCAVAFQSVAASEPEVRDWFYLQHPQKASMQAAGGYTLHTLTYDNRCFPEGKLGLSIQYTQSQPNTPDCGRSATARWKAVSGPHAFSVKQQKKAAGVIEFKNVNIQELQFKLDFASAFEKPIVLLQSPYLAVCEDPDHGALGASTPDDQVERARVECLAEDANSAHSGDNSTKFYHVDNALVINFKLADADCAAIAAAADGDVDVHLASVGWRLHQSDTLTEIPGYFVSSSALGDKNLCVVTWKEIHTGDEDSLAVEVLGAHDGQQITLVVAYDICTANGVEACDAFGSTTTAGAAAGGARRLAARDSVSFQLTAVHRRLADTPLDGSKVSDLDVEYINGSTWAMGLVTMICALLLVVHACVRTTIVRGIATRFGLWSFAGNDNRQSELQAVEAHRKPLRMPKFASTKDSSLVV